MDNKNFKKFINQDFCGLSNWLNTLDSYEFSLIGVISAYLIAPSLNANQMNSVGNFLEEIGQILLTIAAQEINIQEFNEYNRTGDGIYNTSSIQRSIDEIWKEINNLKK